MKFCTTFICYLLLLSLVFPPLCLSENGLIDNTFEISSESTYLIAPDDSPKIYESLCFFNAKYKAVVISAKYLNHMGIMKNYGKRKREIYCLVADNLKTTIIKKSLKGTNEYYIKIKTNVNIVDFTKAEIKNIELEKQEEKFKWQEEMEQYVYKNVEPGEEISRAYRYLRKNEWRIAIIYLDHLQKKYPNWHEIYFAKAVGYYAENKPKAMINALHTSCSLGNSRACEDLKGFSENHEEIKFE